MTLNESDPVQRYLDELQRELRWRRVAASEAALSDAREFLECEREQLGCERATMPVSEMHAHFVRVFGTPGDIAASYAGTAERGGTRSVPGRTAHRRWLRVAVMVVAMLGGMAGLCVASFLREPPKLSPFTAVRHDGHKVIVRFRDREFELLALDDMPTDKITRAAKDNFGDRWQKRFAEDLVEVLWSMNHNPGSTVKLELRELDTGKRQTIADAVMTEANRTAVWYARNAESSRKRQALSAEHLNALVGLFKAILHDRWSYYSYSAPTIDAVIDERFGDVPQPTDDSALALELQKVIAHGIDGHAEVSGWDLAPGYLPFLIERSGNSYVAIHADRRGFLADGYPYITAIDGHPMDEWLAHAKTLVPKSSAGYIERHALRHLRNVQHWRREIGLPQDVPLRIDLKSEDGRVTAVTDLPIAERVPQYGVWPRSESRVLPDNIGYLRLASMDDTAVDEIKRRMAEFRRTDGLIVDVRDNGGGSRDALRWLASYLMAENDPPRVVNCAKYRLYGGFEDDHLTSRQLYRAEAPEWTAAERDAIKQFRTSFKPEWQPPDTLFSDWHYMVLARNDDSVVYRYSKPFVVLMNPKCFSATDVFLAALKGWPNVTLLGTASGGGSAKSENYRLGDTSIHVRLGSMVSFMPGGELFDTNGVQPDIVMEPEPGYFIGRSDRTLEAAVKLIQQR